MVRDKPALQKRTSLMLKHPALGIHEPDLRAGTLMHIRRLIMLRVYSNRHPEKSTFLKVCANCQERPLSFPRMVEEKLALQK
jgi:hypothetical protein